MLFEEERSEFVKRPALEKGRAIDYEIGFLFNFASQKSTRFDLEPILIYNKEGGSECKRISIQVPKGQAYLQPLDDDFFRDFMEFSDNSLLKWMTWTGNRFIRNHSGAWTHVSGKELIALRRHYIDLLQALWPRLSVWPHVFIHRSGKLGSQISVPIQLAKERPSLRLKVSKEKNEVWISLNTIIAGKIEEVTLLGGFLFEKNNVLYLPNKSEDLSLIRIFRTGPLKFPLNSLQEVVEKHIIPWMNAYEILFDPELKVEIDSPKPNLQIQLSELNESNLMIQPQFIYDERLVELNEGVYEVVQSNDHVRVIERDKNHESEVYEYLRTLHPIFGKQKNNRYYYLPFDEVMKRSWFISFIRSLQQADYRISGLSELKKFKYHPHPPKIAIKASSKMDWFDLTVTIQWGTEKVALKEIRQAILHGQHTIMLKDGTLGHIPEEWISQYGLLFRMGEELKGTTLRLKKIHYSIVEDILDKVGNGEELKKDIETRKQRLLNYDSIEAVPLSKEIKATLRPYQQSGFNWLQALDDLGWGGCLADDMGLGKTLQTISFLQFVKEKYRGSTQLVVCPTSLIFNWENELQKFCPTLKFFIYYGSQRELNKNHFEEYDIVLTTYGVVRNDLDELTTFLWQYLILDESQAIKNPDAKVTKAVRKLQSVNRIILSGTPVQNNTMDLYAQFNFVNPGLLGNREFFSREYAQPIDKDNNEVRTKQLQRLLYPFILRRTKEQVASDLPDKTVSILWCTMGESQRKLYEEYRNNYRNILLKKIDEEGIGKSGIYVLEGLMKLRQICDHPAILKSDTFGIDQSVKMEELIREVRENAGNHKLLIFSQFTSMLKLIGESFSDHGISFSYLDGSTPIKKRKEEINRFQEDENIRAFLISLKAGGVGLNLTVADYVYVVDPWWNPAAEQQAIDRAHRIGQKRKVFAYKMICKDTVEEKIVQLQERKRVLADELVQEDSGVVKKLTREDVEFLFG